MRLSPFRTPVSPSAAQNHCPSPSGEQPLDHDRLRHDHPPHAGAGGRGGARPWRRRAARLGTALAALAAAAGLLTAPAQTAAAGTGTLHGAFVRPSSDATAFSNLTGRKLQIVTGFLPETSWSQITDPYPMNLWKGRGYRMHWSVPMLPESGASLKTGATGAYNSHFKKVAQNLVNAGQANSVVRLGWEMNCSCQTWSAKQDPASYVAFWRQAVGAMRSVSGQRFTFLWAPGSGNSLGTFATDRAYPGDAWVDAVGASLYDHSENFRPEETVARWGHFYDQDFGLRWLADFGKQHGKPIALAEWGLSSLSSGWGGGDDSYFIKKVYEYVSNNNVLFESYFNYDPSSAEKHKITGSTFPNAKATYKSLWSKGFVPGSTTASSGPTATSGTVLQWTKNSDGSGTGYALNGSTLRGMVYVTAEVSAAQARSVAFYLDTPTSGTPTHVESDAPFHADGVSAISGRANPIDGAAMSPGTHTLSAVVTGWDGAKRTVTATFKTA
ncbi:glycosyl hydrolase [Kineococcus sp. SYSU DK005]|uniref:glycosyl hydrolase n=1 Tax=Kineococcus sp. SYSU DK005 TaxID=3383126 RepID=UPI003D7CB938